MPFQIPLFGGDCAAPALTDTAGRVLTCLVPPRQQCFTRLLSIQYTVGTTGHTLTVLREKGRTTTTAVAAAGQAVIVLAADPAAAPLGPNGTASRIAADATAAGDWLAMELPDGTFWFDKVVSLSTLSVTLTNNLPTGGVASGAVVWFFGAATDANPLDPVTVLCKGATTTTTNTSDPVFDAPAQGSGTAQINFGGIASEDIIGLCRSPVKYSPLLIQSNNATVAGILERYSWAHSDR